MGQAERREQLPAAFTEGTLHEHVAFITARELFPFVVRGIWEECRPQRTGLFKIILMQAPSRCWGGCLNVNWSHTFTAAHVHNNFQSSLLSCQQRYGLSQLLVSGLKKKERQTTNCHSKVWKTIFRWRSLVKAHKMVFALGMEDLAVGVGKQKKSHKRLEGQAGIMIPLGAVRHITAPWVPISLHGFSKCCLVSWREQINIQEFWTEFTLKLDKLC